MNQQQLSKKKKAAGGITLQQPKMQRAATLTTRGQTTLEETAEQVQIRAAVQELLGNIYHEHIGSFENGVLVSHYQTLEEYLKKTYRRKIYQLRRSKRFYYLFNDVWVLITWEAVKEEYARRCGKQHADSFARSSTIEWAEVCQDFGQIIWNEDIKELHGKEVIA
jgi:hypothetical protein